MKKQLIFLTILCFCYITFATEQFVVINTEKDNYLVYEPIYLEIEFMKDKIPEGFYISALDDEISQIGLRITLPDGKQIEYSTMWKFSNFPSKEKDMIYFETVIVQKGEVITAKPGIYLLSIFNKSDNLQISNELSVQFVNPATSDQVEAIKSIQKNPNQYGLFMYLNGGDHLAEGKEIVETLAELETPVQEVARAVVAMNYSQLSYNWAKREIRREKDPVKVNNFFPKISELKKDQYMPKYLTLAASNLVLTQIDNSQLSSEVKKNIQDIKLKYTKTILEKGEFSKVKEF